MQAEDEYVCASAGALVPGDTCMFSNDCAAGFYCSQEGICREYCLDDSDCSTECFQFNEPYYAATSPVGVCLFPPDLQVAAWSAQSFQDGSLVYFCLNQNPDGTEAERGEYIEIANAGDMATPGPYQIAIGLQSEASGEQYQFSDHFFSEDPHPGGTNRTWAGPYCVGGDVSMFEPGDYRFFVLVDDLNEVNESDESNNIDVATSLFTIGAVPAEP